MRGRHSPPLFSLSSEMAREDGVRRQEGSGRPRMVDTDIVLQLTSETLPCGDPLITPSTSWSSKSPYVVAASSRWAMHHRRRAAGVWSAVETMALELCSRGKDLRAAILLVRAHLHNAGFVVCGRPAATRGICRAP